MPKYVIKAPTGETLEVTADHYPTADEQSAIFTKVGGLAPASPQTFTRTAVNGKVVEATATHDPSEKEWDQIFKKAGLDRVYQPGALSQSMRGGPQTITDSPSQPPGLLERAGRSMFESAAAPRTPADFFSLIMGGTDAVDNSMKIPAVARTVTKAADVSGRGLEATGGAMERVAETIPAQQAGMVGAMYQLYQGNLKTAAVALFGPSILSVAGKGLKVAGKAMQVARPAAGPAMIGGERYAPNVSGYRPGAAAGESALPLQGSVDARMPNTSGYRPGAPAGEAAHPFRPSADPHAPNVSGYEPGAATGDAAQPFRPSAEPHAPNVSGYQPGAAVGDAAIPTSVSAERYAPNVSGYQPAAAEGASAIRSAPPATFVKLDQAGWGITGRNLVPGETVRVMHGDVAHLMRVGRILETSKDGSQTALLAGESAAETALIQNFKLTAAEMVQGLSLTKQGYSASDALKAVLAARVKK